MAGVPRVLLLPSIVLALALAVGGCDSDDGPAAAPAPRQHSASPTSRAADAAPSPTTTPGHAGAGHHVRHRGRHRGVKPAPQLLLRAADAHLLPGERMPTLGDDFSWTVVASGPEDARAIGACQKTSLETIGAVTAVRRRFTGADPSVSATQVVAHFADHVSAARAHAVLLAWRADCEERLDYARKSVGPVRAVRVRAGTGESYRAVFGPRSVSRGRTTGLGIVWKGSYLSVVEVTTPAADYPTEWDPARRAVRRIARTFA
jgi:hypothetical protein